MMFIPPCKNTGYDLYFGQSKQLLLKYIYIMWRVQYKLLVFVFTALHGLAPGYIRYIITPYLPTRNLRSADLHLLVVPRYNPEGYGKRAFSVSGSTLWNSLPENMRKIDNLTKFNTLLKTNLFKLAEEL